MSLSDYLGNLQNKSRHVKVVILWTGTVIFMTILFIFWIMTIGIGPAEQNSAADQPQSPDPFAEVKQEVPSLWQSLKAGISQIFESSNDNQTGQSDNQPSQPKIEIETPGTQGQEIVPPALLP